MPDFFLINGHKVRVVGFCAQDLGDKYRILPANTDDDAVIEIKKHTPPRYVIGISFYSL